jgi:CheY-like chemotaxis protein
VAEALAHFDADSPDMVVSDIGMAGEDGYALLERVRALRTRDGRPCRWWRSPRTPRPSTRPASASPASGLTS